MADDPFDMLLQRMHRTGVASPEELVGCTPAEISALEAKYGIRLPATYHRFLSVMGRRSGRLFSYDWLAWSYDSVMGMTAGLRDEALEFAAESPECKWASFALPADALVVLHRDMSGDYHFIRCDRADDSGVWHFSSDDLQPWQFRQSVVGWLGDFCDEAAEAVAAGQA